MKKILTIFIVVLSLQGFSQGWAEVGAIWHYTQRTINPDLISYNTFESVADDTINGIQCKRMIEIDRYWGDSILKTHYMYSSNDSVFFFRDGDFHLLLYFGAVAGDTVVLGFGTASGDPLLMIVDSTSTVDINGETRIIQYVSCGDGLVIEFAEEVIEGIGGTYYMFPVLDGQPYGALRCYEDSVVGLFLSPFHPNHNWNFEECDEIITGIDEIVSDKKVAIFPNPATNQITLRSNNQYPGSSIYIFNVTGSLREMVQLQEKQDFINIDVSAYPGGIYIVELRDGRNIFRQKFIKQ